MLKEKMNDGCAMSVAGLDPSGGAGIICDCKTFHAHGIYATTVVTALTAQNPYSVTGIEAVNTDFIEEQIDQIMDVYPIEYMKTGVLYSKDIVKCVSKKIKEYQLKAVVDPVLISESGKNLSEDNFVESLHKYLLKNAFIITPNVHEAERIADKKIESQEDMIDVAYKLSKYCNVVVTGGHMEGNDIVVEDDNLSIIESQLINSDNTHGTGCTYSSALTSRLIQGYDIIESCKMSKNFMVNAIRYGFNRTPYQFWEYKF